MKLKFPHREISAAIRAFSRIESADDFAQKLDTLMEVGTACEKRPGQKNHIYGWLLRLWSQGVIAIPRDFPFKTKMSLNPNAFMTRGFQWLGDIQNAYGGKNRASVVATLFRVAGRTLGVVEPGDITPETIAPVEGAEVRRALAFMVSPLLLVQRELYGAKVTHSRLSWGIGRPKRKTGIDRTFSWAIQDDPTLSVWQGALTDWLRDQRQGLALRTHMAERALQYLVDNPHLPRTVEAYCSRKTPINPSWAEWVGAQAWAVSSRRNYTNYLADFFDWYLATALTSEDDFGRPVLSPAHYNPITRLSSRAKQAETHREALPLRYLHELMRIIADDDYAWPKTIRGDYFMWKDPMTGEFSRQWNPVRAYAILTKLMLPLRTYQVRMLDSGEADPERLTGKVWIWTRIAISPSRPCGLCQYCQQGLQNHCVDMRYYGSAMRKPHVQGAFRQQTVVDRMQAHIVSDAISDGEAAMAEPLSVALHAVRRAGPLLGKSVLVTGCGPIGALIVAAARRAGAVVVMATDVSALPLTSAMQMGADKVFNIRENPEALASFSVNKGSFDVLFEASGNEHALRSAINAVRPRGVIVQVGLGGEMNLPINTFVAKEFDLRGAFRFHEEFAIAVELLNKGLINVKPLISATFPYQESVKAFEFAADRSRAMKVLVSFE